MTTFAPSVLSDAELVSKPLPQRPLGKLGWNASVLTLGGVKWDVKCSDAEAAALVHRAIELGVNTFDTAHIYGNGESERKLGLALEGERHRIWLNTKVIDRSYDGAKRMFETSLQRLRTDYVDLLFVHSLDTEDQREQITQAESVLKAIEEYRRAGNVRYIGISGHWVKDVMLRILGEYAFDAALFPVGLFNRAYNYSVVDSVLPYARAKEMAVLGMKIYGAGRVKQAGSIAPYLRYAIQQDIDTAVIGMDSIAHLEETVRILKSAPAPLSEAEVQALLPEAIAITQEWDVHEFSWVQGYQKS
ncbi:MAG: aldo/keto reductase [Chthonomonadaceae bacterium]|nr:aldo/keto reductase [Chthonomonadaceae bacterium]